MCTIDITVKLHILHSTLPISSRKRNACKIRLKSPIPTTNQKENQRKIKKESKKKIKKKKNNVTKQGQLTQQYHDDKKQGSLDFGEYSEYRNGIEKRLDAVFNPDAVKPENVRQTKEAHFDQKKFSSKQFQDMWKKINQQTYYAVDFKTDDLIEKAIAALDHHLVVSEIRIEVVKGKLGDEIKNNEKLQQGEAMKISGTHTQNVRELIGSRVKYDIIGKLVENTVGIPQRGGCLYEVVKWLLYQHACWSL